MIQLIEQSYGTAWRILLFVEYSRSIKPLYTSVTLCIRINNLHTNRFDLNCDLRQGGTFTRSFQSVHKCSISEILLS